MHFDTAASQTLSRLASVPGMEALGGFFNALGKGDALAFLCILVVLAGVLTRRSHWIKMGLCGILVLSLSGIAVQTFKHIFGRARPQMNLGDFHFIGPNLAKNGYDAFPSGHTVSGFCMASFFAAFFPPLAWIFYTVAGCIAILGRVLFRHHFLTDVIAGGILGLWIGRWGARKFSPWILKQSPPREEVPPSPGRDRSRARDFLIVAAFSGAVLFTGLTAASLWDRDETEYAQSCLEMQQNKEWLIPTLEGQPFIEKPIFLFWMVRASYRAFGVNDFAARFPSALFGVGTALATYLLGHLLFGAEAGLLGALTLSGSLLFAGTFRMLLTDPFFVFFSLLALLFYALMRIGKRPGLSWLGCYFSMGWAVLCKGPIGFFPTIVFLLAEWMERRSLRAFLKNAAKHLAGLLIASAVAAPWFLYSFKAQEAATSTFFLYDNLMRFLRPSEGHRGPMFYYVLVLAAGLLPWSFFLAPALNRVSRPEPRRPNFDTLLLIWCLFLFAFFSVSATKLPHYILPIFPPLCLFLGRYWSEEGTLARKMDWIPLRITSVMTLILLAAPLALYKFRPGYASWKLVLPFALLAAALWIADGKSRTAPRGTIFKILAGGSLAFLTSAWAAALPWVEEQRVMKPIALALKERLEPDSKVYGYFVSEPSLFFYSEKLFPLVENGTLDDLLKSGRSVFVITRQSTLDKNPPRTPYALIARKEGFAENGGEMTTILISNAGAGK